MGVVWSRFLSKVVGRVYWEMVVFEISRLDKASEEETEEGV